MPTTPREAVQVFNKNSLATPLLLAFVDIYGLDTLCGDDDQRWDPQTVEMEMHAVSGGVLPQNLDKLMAIAEVLNSDHFETSLPDFIRICNVLADSPTDGTFDPAEVREIAWAIVETGLVLGRKPQFSKEICGYIAHALKDEGFTEPPQPIDVILPDPDIGWENTNQNTDDPDLFVMTQDAADGRAQEVAQYLGTRLQTMIQQIHHLPLTAPQADWTSNILQELKVLLSHGDQSSTGEMA